MISIKTPEEIRIMKEGGNILARVLAKVAAQVKPGVTTQDLDKAAEALILKYKATPAFKGYMGFPAAMCTSVNEEIVHCFPSGRVLKEGDIICLDLGLKYKGFYSDMAMTVAVGKISRQIKKLLDVARKSLDLAIKKVKPGVAVSQIGELIEGFIEGKGFGVVRELCGHGIGKEIHEDPQVPNYFDEKAKTILKEGMVICIEPMITMGDWRIKKAKDGYGFQTKDSSFAAHFEHTIAVTKKGSEVLTK